MYADRGHAGVRCSQRAQDGDRLPPGEHLDSTGQEGPLGPEERNYHWGCRGGGTAIEGETARLPTGCGVFLNYKVLGSIRPGMYEELRRTHQVKAIAKQRVYTVKPARADSCGSLADVWMELCDEDFVAHWFYDKMRDLRMILRIRQIRRGLRLGADVDAWEVSSESA